MRTSQDWIGENITGKTKNPTLDERWESPGLISGGAACPIRPIFWGEGNGPMTLGGSFGRGGGKQPSSLPSIERKEKTVKEAFCFGVL